MRHGPGQLHAAVLEILRGGHEPGLAKRRQRYAHFRNEFDARAVEGRFVQIGLAIVRRELFLGDLRGRVERRVERLARMLGEARTARQALDVQQFVKNEIEIPAIQQLWIASCDLFY